MTAILNLKPEDEKRLHPVALNWFNDQCTMIEREVAHHKLTDGDIDNLLSDNEVRDLLHYKAEIGKALAMCTRDSDAAFGDPVVNDYIGFRFLLLQVYSFPSIEKMSALLRRVAARRRASEFGHLLNRQIVQLRSLLHHRLQDLSSYLWAEIRDKRFTGHDFSYVLSAEDKRNLDATLASVAYKRLLQLIPHDLRQFISLPPQYYRVYLPLPKASYSLEEAPSLAFSFEVFTAANAEVWIKPAKKSFGDYEFAMPQLAEKSCLVPLQKPRLLGYHLSILRPEDLGGYVFWRSIPLILLGGLLCGQTKLEGTTISAASDEATTYRIPGVEHEITIPNTFADYLRTIGTIDKMVNMNILTEKVASIVKSEFNELKQECQVPSSKRSMRRRDTKKAKVYQLFDKGRRPSDPEVKALGIKPSSAYRYFQAWKRACSHG